MAYQDPTEVPKRVPVMICDEIDGQLVFRCPACRRKHYHGAAHLNPGHRVSHCTTTVYDETGYIVVPRRLAESYVDESAGGAA